MKTEQINLLKKVNMNGVNEADGFICVWHTFQKTISDAKSWLDARRHRHRVHRVRKNYQKRRQATGVNKINGELFVGG